MHGERNLMLERCAPELFRGVEERVTLELGACMLHPDEPATTLYFPITCVASCVRRLSDGSTVEVGLLGYEGFVGMHSVFGASAQLSEVTAQVAGEAVRVPLDAVRSTFDSDSTFRGLVLRFANSFAAQVGQSAACNRLHPLEQRLARWLLMVTDRTRDTSLRITQEFLAQMLGTRTAGVNEAIASLTNSGLISHARGAVQVLDLDGLEQSTCECYRAVVDAYRRDEVMEPFRP